MTRANVTRQGRSPLASARAAMGAWSRAEPWSSAGGVWKAPSVKNVLCGGKDLCRCIDGIGCMVSSESATPPTADSPWSGMGRARARPERCGRAPALRCRLVPGSCPGKKFHRPARPVHRESGSQRCKRAGWQGWRCPSRTGVICVLGAPRRLGGLPLASGWNARLVRALPVTQSTPRNSYRVTIPQPSDFQACSDHSVSLPSTWPLRGDG